MIKITVGINMDRKVLENKDESTYTVRQACDEAGLDYNRYTCHLAGNVVTADMLDKTFAECDIYEDCFLVSVSKTDSAAA